MTIQAYVDIPDAPESVRVELRCPVPVRGCAPGKLFALLAISGGDPSYIHPDNLIVLACLDCKRQTERAEGLPRRSATFRVLHCYDFAGNLVKTMREDVPDD